MLQSEFAKKYPNFIENGITYTPQYECSDITIIYNEENDIVDYELVDFKLIKTAEEIAQSEYIEPQPSKIEILEGKVEGLLESQRALEESQQVQDLLIDDIVFEVIPTLESQINVSDNTAPTNVVILTDRLGKVNGGMPTYLAKKIIGGKDYKEVFKINAYKQYQEEVDRILIEQNREDLIIK